MENQLVWTGKGKAYYYRRDLLVNCIVHGRLWTGLKSLLTLPGKCSIISNLNEIRYSFTLSNRGRQAPKRRAENNYIL